MACNDNEPVASSSRGRQAKTKAIEHLSQTLEQHENECDETLVNSDSELKLKASKDGDPCDYRPCNLNFER